LRSVVVGGLGAATGREDPAVQANVHAALLKRKLGALRSLQVVQGTAHRPEGRPGDMRVELGGASALVTEKFLDDTEVGAALQEVRREAVASMPNSA